jgi:hypothetical protein
MRWLRRLSRLALVAGAAGCVRFHPSLVPAPEASGWRSIGRARVTTVESQYYVLRDVEVTADSVTGYHDVSGTPLQPPNRRRIALHRSEVRRFEEARIDRVRTGILALAAAYVVAVAVSFRSMDW